MDSTLETSAFFMCGRGYTEQELYATNGRPEFPLRIHLDNFTQFPSDEEEQGHVAMAWRLPYRLIDGIKTMQGIKLLASYLTFTQVREIS